MKYAYGLNPTLRISAAGRARSNSVDGGSDAAIADATREHGIPFGKRICREQIDFTVGVFAVRGNDGAHRPHNVATGAENVLIVETLRRFRSATPDGR